MAAKFGIVQSNKLMISSSYTSIEWKSVGSLYLLPQGNPLIEEKESKNYAFGTAKKTKNPVC
jgi:hypothetical protein